MQSAKCRSFIILLKRCIMKKFKTWLLKVPLEGKIFIASCMMIFGIFLIPIEKGYDIIILTYIVFIFVSSIISGTYWVYVGDSQYNFFRKATTTKRLLTLVGSYILICSLISYVLSVTEWFLFIFR